ncbi:hypothetical protein BH23ACT9_BH23ACT9_20550 [soil metagenome]
MTRPDTAEVGVQATPAVTTAPAPVAVPTLSTPTAVPTDDERVTVPAGLVGQDITAAVHALTDAGLRADIRGQVAAGVADGQVLSVQPPAGTAIEQGARVEVAYAIPTAPTTAAPPAAGAPRIVLLPGNPAGSGCTPGPGPLPDDQWIGYVTAADPTQLLFDLVCYDSGSQAVSNSNPAVRPVPLGADADVRCINGPCSPQDLSSSTVTVVQIVGGQARHVHPVASLQTGPPPPPAAPTPTAPDGAPGSTATELDPGPVPTGGEKVQDPSTLRAKYLA